LFVISDCMRNYEGEKFMVNHYLIQDDDGVLTVFRCKIDGNGHWKMFGTVPPEEMPPALAVGMKVVEKIHDDEEIDDESGLAHRDMEDFGGPCYLRIWLKQKKPIPLTGMDWLKSKPDGYRFIAEGRRYVTFDNGIFEFQTKALISWKRLKKKWSHFLEHLNEESCPTWEPDAE